MKRMVEEGNLEREDGGGGRGGGEFGDSSVRNNPIWNQSSHGATRTLHTPGRRKDFPGMGLTKEFLFFGKKKNWHHRLALFS